MTCPLCHDGWREVLYPDRSVRLVACDCPAGLALTRAGVATVRSVIAAEPRARVGSPWVPVEWRHGKGRPRNPELRARVVAGWRSVCAVRGSAEPEWLRREPATVLGPRERPIGWRDSAARVAPPVGPAHDGWVGWMEPQPEGDP